MKVPVKIVLLAIAYTVILFLCVRLLLPPPPPTGLEFALLAAIGLLFSWGTISLWSKITSRLARKPSNRRKTTNPVIILLAFFLLPFMTGCPSELLQISATGIATLLPGQTESADFGLYSYALISHHPDQEEYPQYRAFIRALIGLPTAEDLQKYQDSKQINVTYLLITKPVPEEDENDPEKMTDFVLQNYDVARGAAIRGSLPNKDVLGPVLVSALDPIKPGTAPNPLLFQDLSLAQPQIMASYVNQFKNQVEHPQFWKPDTLEAFTLGLRNLLSITAAGLDGGKSAVSSWIQFFKN